MRMRPIANGVAEVWTEERDFSHLSIRMEEQSDSVLLVVATSKRTGKTVFVETTTLVDDLRRVRSVQV